MTVPSTIKGIIAYVLSLELILASISSWLLTVGDLLSTPFQIGAQIISFFVGAAGLIISYYTIKHLREKLRGQRLDNIIKELEIQEKTKQEDQDE